VIDALGPNVQPLYNEPKLIDMAPTIVAARQALASIEHTGHVLHEIVGSADVHLREQEAPAVQIPGMPTGEHTSTVALDLAKDCAASYSKAKREVRKMWNRAFFNTIRVRDGAAAGFTYGESFESLLGSHKDSMVVPT
jgi:hypothetical protein